MGTPFQINIVAEGLEMDTYTAVVRGSCDGKPESVIPLIKRVYDAIGKSSDEKSAWCKESLGEQGKGVPPKTFHYIRGRSEYVASFFCAADPSAMFPAPKDMPEDRYAVNYNLYLVNKAHGSAAEDPDWDVEIKDMGKVTQERISLDRLVNGLTEVAN